MTQPSTYTDAIESICGSESLQTAFRDYFTELGVTVRNWDGLFREVNGSDSRFLVRRDAAGDVAGFVLFARKEMTSGFFTAVLGCVEELYVRPALRGCGCGAALLAAAETELRRMGCGLAILTSDSAPAFYLRQGYAPAPAIAAKNGDPVFVKPLEPLAGM